MRSLLALACLAGPALAEAPRLLLPIDCTLGEDCYIQQLMDHDPGPQDLDFQCGTLTYDGHSGTDFALPTLADLSHQVVVRAAAAGVVAGIRNDMPDIAQGTPDAPDLAGRDCGNGVVLTHPDGWETQYCHLARGSVRVAPGDRVDAGDPLGIVGLSGNTEFPHLHLSLRHEGIDIDPFDPDGVIRCDAPPDPPLWIDPPEIQPGGLLSAGLTDSVPDYAEIRAGSLLAPPGRDTPIVAWGYFFAVRQGDSIDFRIDGPTGEVFAHRESFDRRLALGFRAAGLRAPPEGWPRGTYTARLFLLRDGERIDERDVSVRLP